MLFGKCTVNTKVRIELDGLEIERVHENKFLGVTVDDRLSWKPHIKHVQFKFKFTFICIAQFKKNL